MTDVSLKFANTSKLRIAYHDWGAQDGSPVILLHGWPDSAATWNQTKTALAAAGHRVLIPHLRGHGETRFIDDAIPRSGQLGALVLDTLEFMDALHLSDAAIVGHDWGARIAYALAHLEPQRVRRCVALSVGWGGNAPSQALSLEQTQSFWYQWFLATSRGEHTLRTSRQAFTRHIWHSWSPGWDFSDDEFNTTASAFENSDWCDVSLSYYRHRWGFIEPDPVYADLERSLATPSVTRVATLVLHGETDACNLVATSISKRSLFAGRYQHIAIPETGHFPQRENPAVVSDAIRSWLSP